MGVIRGTIISIIAGHYFVEAQNRVWVCRARGRLRLNDLPPLTGDIVKFSATEEGDCTLEEVLPRTNYLLRPAIANIDGVVVVLTPKDPPPNLLMADKLLALLVAIGIEGILCVNKVDLDEKEANSLAKMYRKAGFKSQVCSALTGEGLLELGSLLENRTVVLAGQSGVGKSHISSKIAGEKPDLPLEIGNLSAKVGRGKHTTRQVSLLPLKQGGKIADTPGFGVFELDLPSNELHRYFPEFNRFGSCRFSPCYHIHEPDCAVKTGLEQNKIWPSRYDNYVRIFNELKEKEANRY